MISFNCPECHNEMLWQNDFQEDQMSGEVEKKVVTYFVCLDCEIRLYKHRNLTEELKQKIVAHHMEKAKEMKAYAESDERISNI